MTDYNVTVGKELLPELLSGQDGLAKLIESVLNQVLDVRARFHKHTGSHLSQKVGSH